MINNYNETTSNVYEHNLKIQAPYDQALYLWIEPWGDGLVFPANTSVELKAISSIEGQLELDITPKRTAVYGWAGCILRIFVDGKLVHSFDQPVPNGLSKNAVTLLFGLPPTPKQD